MIKSLLIAAGVVAALSLLDTAVAAPIGGPRNSGPEARPGALCGATAGLSVQVALAEALRDDAAMPVSLMRCATPKHPTGTASRIGGPRN